MVLTASFVLSPVIGLSCHRHLADTSAKLDASVEASGPHDFAVHPARVRLARLKRPPHPALHVRDDRERPSCEAGQRGLVEMICPTGKTKYFLAEDWTLESALILQANFSSTRNRDHAKLAASIMRASIVRLGKAHSMMIGSSMSGLLPRTDLAN